MSTKSVNIVKSVLNGRDSALNDGCFDKKLCVNPAEMTCYYHCYTTCLRNTESKVHFCWAEYMFTVHISQ